MPVWLLIVGGILLFFALLLAANIRVSVLVNDGETILRIRYLFLRFDPLKERKPQKEKREKKPEKADSAEKKPDEDKMDGFKRQLSQVRELVGPVVRAAKKLLTGVRIRNFVLYLEIGKEDAAATAVEYGRLCALVYGAYAAAANVFYIPDPDIRISANYVEEGFRWRFGATVKVRLLLLVRIGFRLLFDLVKTKLSKENKGGANDERDTIKRRNEHNHAENQGND